MIRLIKFILYLLHRYYNKGSDADIAYFSAVSCFMAIVYMNLLTLLGILNFDIEQIIPYNEYDATWMQYLKFAVIIALPGYLLIYIFFKEESIKKLAYNESRILLGQVFLILYILLTLLAFVYVSYNYNN